MPSDPTTEPAGRTSAGPGVWQRSGAPMEIRRTVLADDEQPDAQLAYALQDVPGRGREYLGTVEELAALLGRGEHQEARGG